MKLRGVAMLCIALIFGLTSCNQQNNGEAQIELIEKYIDAVEAKDVNIMSEMLADDYMGYGPSHNDSINKENAVAMWERNATELYEKIEYKKSRNMMVNVPDGENAGDWVSNWAIMEITYKDGSGPIQAWANTTYLIRNEKITKTFTFYNEADILEQLGYVFVDVDDLYE